MTEEDKPTWCKCRCHSYAADYMENESIRSSSDRETCKSCGHYS